MNDDIATTLTRRRALGGAAAAGLAALLPASAAQAAGGTAAGTIMIIRHGEKPPKDGGPPYGLTAAGDHDSSALTTDGWARAGALVSLFAPSRGTVPAGLATPASVFACRPQDGSNLREGETVSLLARRLGVRVQTPCTVGQERELAGRLRAARGPALVCWEHKHIADITTHLGTVRPAVPRSWPSDRFDIVYVLVPSATGYAFTQIPELLLPGDSARPIA